MRGTWQQSLGGLCAFVVIAMWLLTAFVGFVIVVTDVRDGLREVPAAQSLQGSPR